MVESAWNIELVKAPAARDLLPRAADGSIDWGDIKLCHLDTGYTDHPTFRDPISGQTWLRPEEGRNFIEGGPPLDPVDNRRLRGKSFGHGTRTLSVICGSAVDLDDGRRLAIGVAPGLPTVPCRVTSWVVLLSPGSRQGVAQGIGLAIARHCQVVSMSLGTLVLPPFSTGGLNDAVDAAYERGVILVAAAGQETDRVTFPGKFQRTIACAAVGPDRRPWQRQFWQSHPDEMARVDAWAPGDEVPVAVRQVAGTAAADSPGSFASVFESSSNSSASKGSSYATAHVAAAAAMWLRHRQADIAAAYPAQWQRVEAFRTLLRTSKGHLSGLRPANGTGMLDIKKLLESALPPAAALQPAPRAERHFA
jgi:subtilisin family serine protease